MRCNAARFRIDLELDEGLQPRQQEELTDHLHQCESCRAYRQRVRGLASILNKVSEADSAHTPSYSFDVSLRSRLQSEHDRRANAPIERLCAALSFCGLHATRKPNRALAGALGALALTALALVLLRAPLSLAERQPAFAADHLTRFTVRAAPDGRVYARLQSRTSLPRGQNGRSEQ